MLNSREQFIEVMKSKKSKLLHFKLDEMLPNDAFLIFVVGEHVFWAGKNQTGERAKMKFANSKRMPRKKSLKGSSAKNSDMAWLKALNPFPK